ncbi:MAG: hypothetical protein HY265_07295 [Deltaproteobacteria bacterium]|nr:hypothetical protein [Deltaproteobacteria bacterium]
MLEAELLLFVKKLAKDISSLPEHDMRVQLRISLGLLEFLLAQDLKEAVQDGNLHPQVRMAAKERLEEKG